MKMPRPGPRPYECAKRAWHSDRHQPIRGSLIQQIFRLAKDIHKPSTKNNKEWQEKLPTVVFNAEEIMYSKANSEAEYVNLDTLWERANDAVNTIIRRDESSEAGDMLPPCVEAALHLGCVPERASRSQRNSNTRSYLSPRAIGPASPPPLPPRIRDRASNEQCPKSSTLHLSKQPLFMRATTAANASTSVSEPYCRPSGNYKIFASDNHPSLQKGISLGQNCLMAMETSSSPNFGSVYPSYYGTHCRAECSSITTPSRRTNPSPVFVGKPDGISPLEPARLRVASNIFSFNAVQQPEIDLKGTIQNHDNPLEKRCDLSLRLGSLPDARSSTERGEAALRSSQSSVKYCLASQAREKEMCFSPTNITNDPLGFCSSKRLRVGENNGNEVTLRQPATTFSSSVEGRFFWQPDYPPNQFSGHMRGPGL